MSFKEAAKELHVTPSAVSQQIRALESALGLQLFERRPRAIALTEAGAFYLEVARDTLDTFRRGTRGLWERFGKRVLRINMDAVVAYEVVIPALADLQDRCPDLAVRLETSSALVDPRTDSVDAVVRFGRGPWPGLHAEEIAAVHATTVASPALLREVPIESPSDLARHTLIGIVGATDYWALLADQLGFRIGRRVGFDSYLATLQAAAHGVGVALAAFPPSAAWVHDGRLVAPLPFRTSGVGYHWLVRPEDRHREDLGHVRTWLRGRFAALPTIDGV